MRSRPNAQRKIASVLALARAVERSQARGLKVVLTNGCFDLLHAGHVALLERARRLGDVLIVALNSDRSVRALKGPGRPITPAGDRARLIAALESVDHVVMFNEATPARLVARLKPDVLVKGADWAAAAIAGGDSVSRRGGRVVRVPLLKGYSTSRLIERIRRRK